MALPACKTDQSFEAMVASLPLSSTHDESRQALKRHLKRKRLPEILTGGVATGFAAQISLPMATAVSDMRFEKPHSLSYQVRMRHKRPSMTLV